LIRTIVGLVFVAGIASMIVASIADNNGAALTAGLCTAVAALCLILTSALTSPTASPEGGEGALRFDAEGAEALERRIASVVESGADEAEVRDLVRDAVRLGRSTQ
jgi:hypothetical protein